MCRRAPAPERRIAAGALLFPRNEARHQGGRSLSPRDDRVTDEAHIAECRSPSACEGERRSE